MVQVLSDTPHKTSLSKFLIENLSGLHSAVVPLSVIFSFKNNIVNINCDEFTGTNRRH